MADIHHRTDATPELAELRTELGTWFAFLSDVAKATGDAAFGTRVGYAFGYGEMALRAERPDLVREKVDWFRRESARFAYLPAYPGHSTEA